MLRRAQTVCRSSGAGRTGEVHRRSPRLIGETHALPPPPTIAEPGPRTRCFGSPLTGSSLWRGFPLPLITISIVRTVSFSIYSATKRILNSTPASPRPDKEPWVNLHLGILNRDSTLDVALTSLLAGAASGAVVCVGSAPFELVKVRSR